jgi:hypothetical protein
MRIHELAIRGFKQLDVRLRWAPTVVLFGANDAGKTNTLEAIEHLTVFEPDHQRIDPLLPDPEAPTFSALVQLNEGSPDADVLAGLLQVRHLPPIFRRSSGRVVLEDDEVDRGSGEYNEGVGIGFGLHPAALLCWPPLSESLTSRESTGLLTIGCAGDVVDPDNMIVGVGTLPQVTKELRERAIARARPQLDWRRARPAFLRLLDACLGSRWLQVNSEEVLTWLTPRTEECDAKTLEAAGRLALVAGEDPPVVGPLVQQLLEQTDQQPFLHILEEHKFLPWRVVWPSASPERLAELTESIAEFVRQHADFEEVLREQPEFQDSWLEEMPGDGVRVSEVVMDLCQQLSELASEIAPNFVRDHYRLIVEPLPPMEWHRSDDRRLRLVAKPHGSDETYDLAVVGSGHAIWAGVAIEEARRQLEESRVVGIVESLREQGAWSEPPAVDSRGNARQPPQVGQEKTLYVIDEPERHLHPRAQEEASRWIAERVGQGANVVLATHAMPFLSIPSDDVEYCLVGRDGSRTTRSRSISDDVWGVLGQADEFANIGSRAQLLQVLRGLLIVEGAHDEAVLRHFFGSELAKSRIEVLAARGAKGVSALIDAEVVAMLDKPLAILFDDIRLEMLSSDERPPGREVAARAVWDLMRNWPAERHAPTVVEFDLPDIFCALPETCVARAIELQGGKFPGWEQVITAFRSGDAAGFKPFLFSQSGLPAKTNADALLRTVLDVCRVRPREELELAVNRAIAAIQRKRE